MYFIVLLSGRRPCWRPCQYVEAAGGFSTFSAAPATSGLARAAPNSGSAGVELGLGARGRRPRLRHDDLVVVDDRLAGRLRGLNRLRAGPVRELVALPHVVLALPVCDRGGLAGVAVDHHRDALEAVELLERG